MPYNDAGFGNPLGLALTPWVKRLLLANGGAFLLTWALGRVFSPAWIAEYLAFSPGEVLWHPWTLLTYMFVHFGFFHFFFNMLGLLFFGPPLEEKWGSTPFLRFYLVAGLGGAVLSALGALVGLMPAQANIVGASGAVYGIMLAFALYWPDNPIYIWGVLPVKAKWLITFMLVLSLFYALTGGDGGVAHLAHLGGMAAGFLYVKSKWGPNPWGQLVRARKRRNLAVIGGGEQRSAAPPRPAPRASAPRPTQLDEATLMEVDRILDKISASGIGSLTIEERHVLDEASRRPRAR